MCSGRTWVVSLRYVNGVNARFKVLNSNQLLLLIPAATALGSSVVMVEDASGNDSVAVWVDIRPGHRRRQQPGLLCGICASCRFQPHYARESGSQRRSDNDICHGNRPRFIDAAHRCMGRQVVLPSRVTPWSWFSDAEGPFHGMYAVTFTVPTSWAGGDVVVLAGGILGDQRTSTRNGPVTTRGYRGGLPNVRSGQEHEWSIDGRRRRQTARRSDQPSGTTTLSGGNWSHLWAGNGASWPQRTRSIAG